MMTYASFSIGELFECSKGDVDLQNKDINGKGEFFINSGLENKGIKGRTDRPARVFPAGTLTIDFWGNAFYRDYPYKLATHNHVFSLSGDVLKSEAAGLYIEGALAKLPELFSYSNMATWSKLKVLQISLPVIPSPDPLHEYTPDDIDWAYMESCIAELEEERIAELDAYLKVTGLDDCVLAPGDAQALTEAPTFAEFTLESLFECSKGDVDLQNKDINGKGEFFINSGLENKGIKGRTDRPARVFPAGTLTIDFWGNAFYREHSYKLATHNHVFSLSGDVLRNEYAGLYIEGALAKLPQLFSYNNMATWNKLKVLPISLPVIPSPDPLHEYTPADIDWAYMERYIRATEKLVMADVVAYKDKVIATTRQIVSNP